MGHVTELHLHLDGSLRPETVWELAKEQGIRLPAESAEEVKYKMAGHWRNIWSALIFRFLSFREQTRSRV